MHSGAVVSKKLFERVELSNKLDFVFFIFGHFLDNYFRKSVSVVFFV